MLQARSVSPSAAGARSSKQFTYWTTERLMYCREWKGKTPPTSSPSACTYKSERGGLSAKESMRGRQRGSEISTSVEKQAHGGEIGRGRRERRVTGVRGEDAQAYISSGRRGDPHIWLWPVTIQQARGEILSGHCKHTKAEETPQDQISIETSSWCLFSVLSVLSRDKTQARRPNSNFT